MYFTTAYVLGVDQQSNYFGENVARYNSVKTINIEGYIDKRSTNTDYKGVKEVVAAINSYVSSVAATGRTDGRHLY